jgi:Fe-S cluster assembly protein SufD
MTTLLTTDFRAHYDPALPAAGAEPDWAAALRTQAWAHYQNQPEPLPPQRNLRRIPVLELSTLGAPQAAAGDESLASWGPLAASGQMRNAESVQIELPDSLRAQGLIFCSLREALSLYPQQVQATLDQILPAAANREAALNLAYWRNGFFLWVPRQLTVSAPIALLQSQTRGAQALFSRSLIGLEAGAQATVIYEGSAPAQAEASLSSDVLEISLAAGAGLKLIQLQNWGTEAHVHNYSQAQLARDARLWQLNLSLGAAFHYSQTQATLAEKGAESLLLGLTAGAGQQHFRQQTHQNHLSPHTRSDLVYHTVLRDEAYAFFNGLISVHPAAQHSESGQVSKSLLLSDKARADAIPNLEILADDVQSGHGAAIGSLDPEQRFYLMSRGFDWQTAEGLLIEGFMEEVILRFPGEDLQQRIAARLALHLQHEEERDEA